MLTTLRRQFKGLFWTVAAAVLIADVFVIVLTGVSLRASYLQYYERAALASRNTSRLMSQSIASQISRIDMALKAVQDEYAREYASGGIGQGVLRAFLKRQLERLPMASAVRMTDASGIIVLGADDTLPTGVSVADRDYFLAFQKSDYTGTFIARPVFARVTLRWVMNTARRLSRPDGSFDGVIYVQVPLDWFNREFAKLDVGPEGVIALRGDASRDFVIVARYPEAVSSAKRKYRHSWQPRLPPIRRAALTEPIAVWTISSVYSRTSLWATIRLLPWLASASTTPSADGGVKPPDLGHWCSFLPADRSRRMAVAAHLVARQAAYLEIRTLNGALKRDIGARKAVEEALRRHEDQLEETVRMRTAELLLARDAAEAANKAKSAFLANTSHELRTPLNAILGFSSLMRREPDITPGQREKLDIINRSGEHLLTLINNVLEMAKIEAKRLQLERVPFDLGSMVRDVIDMMQIRAKEKGLQLLLDQPSNFPRFIKGDEARLRQILVNLAGNAVKFTSEGSVTVRLRTRQHARRISSSKSRTPAPGSKRRIKCACSSHSCNLPNRACKKAPGWALRSATSSPELMGGSIAVESTLGKGSIFRVVLPAELTAVASAAAQQTRTQSADVCGLAPGQPAYRILIAEDQPENRLLLTKLMTSIGLDTRRWKTANIASRCSRNGTRTSFGWTGACPLWTASKQHAASGPCRTARRSKSSPSPHLFSATTVRSCSMPA